MQTQQKSNNQFKALTIKYLEQFATKLAKQSSCVSLWGEIELPEELKKNPNN